MAQSATELRPPLLGEPTAACYTNFAPPPPLCEEPPLKQARTDPYDHVEDPSETSDDGSDHCDAETSDSVPALPTKTMVAMVAGVEIPIQHRDLELNSPVSPIEASPTPDSPDGGNAKSWQRDDCWWWDGSDQGQWQRPDDEQKEKDSNSVSWKEASRASASKDDVTVKGEVKAEPEVKPVKVEPAGPEATAHDHHPDRRQVAKKRSPSAARQPPGGADSGAYVFVASDVASDVAAAVGAHFGKSAEIGRRHSLVWATNLGTGSRP